MEKALEDIDPRLKSETGSLKDGLDNCADEMRKLRTDSNQLKLENRAFESDIRELDDRLTKEIANLKAKNAGLEQKLETLDKWKSKNVDLLGENRSFETRIGKSLRGYRSTEIRGRFFEKRTG